MPTPDQVRAMSTELLALHAHMLDLTTPSIKAIRYTHAHTTGTLADSLPERATHAHDRLTAEIATLQEIATVLTDADHAGATIEQVAAVLADHAAALAAWPELSADLERIHHRWKTLAYPATETSTHLCPTCGTVNLHWRHADKLYVCPACEYAGTLEHVHTATIWRIKTSDLWIDRAQACELFGLTRDQLKWHIRAGNLHPRGGLIKTTELRTLPRR
ncbi:hypothetical protein V3M69_00890 [Trueperella pyogenes]|uniref:hypothetical protein n=1 Tax=Trueperella pyogenes TaxID=1661 RepID=UPI001432B96C|nr:hypothetical protein [Trueperella pyogenes]QIU87087.1 hypothetical protein HEP79_07600 [Trueperella pyogenes]